MTNSIRPVTLEERDHVIGIVDIIIGVEVAVAGLGWARPGWHNVEPGDHSQPLAASVLDHHIEPGPVETIARARLGIGPRKQVDDRTRAHLAHLAERPRDVGLVANPSEPGVDTN